MLTSLLTKVLLFLFHAQHSQGFDPYRALNAGPIFDHIIASDGHETNSLVLPYQLAARQWLFVDADDVFNDRRPQVVLSRGIPMQQAFLSGFVTRMWMAASVMYALDFIMILLAVSLFLSPLEKMVRTRHTTPTLYHIVGNSRCC
jgi:hypothetical protein